MENNILLVIRASRRSLNRNGKGSWIEGSQMMDLVNVYTDGGATMPNKTISVQRAKLEEEKRRHADKIDNQERGLSLKEEKEMNGGATCRHTTFCLRIPPILARL
jgi:hypothetical protein